jgi:hypothetical protein
MSFQCFAGRKIFLSPRFPSHSSARCWPDLRGRLRPSEGLPWARSALSVTPDEFSGFVSFQCFVEWQIFASPRFPMHGAERCRPDVRGRLRPCEALPWARSALSVAPDGFSGFVSFQCFAERNIFAAPRFSLRGSGAMQAARPQDRHGRACGDVDDRDDPPIESGDGHHGTRGSSRRRSRSQRLRPYGFPGWRVSMKNHSISSKFQKENC